MASNIEQAFKRYLREQLGWQEAYVNSCLADPQFKDTGTVHDWRNYITDDMELLWPSMSNESKLAVLILAERQADAEEWD